MLRQACILSKKYSIHSFTDARFFVCRHAADILPTLIALPKDMMHQHRLYCMLRIVANMHMNCFRIHANHKCMLDVMSLAMHQPLSLTAPSIDHTQGHCCQSTALLFCQLTAPLLHCAKGKCCQGVAWLFIDKTELTSSR